MRYEELVKYLGSEEQADMVIDVICEHVGRQVRQGMREDTLNELIMAMFPFMSVVLREEV